MSLNFNIKLKKKIVCNGQEYGDIDQLPENVKAAVGKALGDIKPGIGVSVNTSMKIVVNGHEYGSVDELPAETRKLYDMAMNGGHGNRTVAEANAATGLLDPSKAGAGKGTGLFSSIFPATLLKWTEPKAVRIARYETDKTGMMRLLPVILIVSALFIFILGRMAPEMQTGKLYVVLAAVTGMMFFFLQVGKLTPMSVSITDKGVVLGYGKNATVWRFDQLDHCELAGTEVEGVVQNILVLQSKRGVRSTIGIAPTVPLDVLQQLMESKGVKVMAPP